MKPWNCDVAFTDPPGIGEGAVGVAGVLDACMDEGAEAPAAGLADAVALEVCFAYKS